MYQTVTNVMHSLADYVLPLLKKVTKWLNGDASDVPLHELYKFLEKNEKFKEAIKLSLNWGIEMALSFLQTVKKHVVKVCQENKELMKALTKTATKSIVRHVAFGPGTKAAVKYGVTKVGSQATKRVINIANPAGIAVDVTQAGFEYFGYEKVGKAIGKWGNIGTGICAGFVIGGPLGATVGALAGFGTWAVGEAVGGAIDEAIG